MIAVKIRIKCAGKIWKIEIGIFEKCGNLVVNFREFLARWAVFGLVRADLARTNTQVWGKMGGISRVFGVKFRGI